LILNPSSRPRDKIVGLRVHAEHEVVGLDLTQHGEEGYDMNA
jgi:ammonia channel protein AmtB